MELCVLSGINRKGIKNSMTKPDKLLKQIKAQNHQGLPVTNMIHVLKQYWPLGQYMLRQFGWKSWYSFWYTKLFVADEGGEYALLNRLYRKFPGLLGKPSKLEMEHTTICDKQCLFCESTYWREPKERITFEQFKRTADPIRSLKWMNITGEGSSFLNKDFIQILEYLRKRHINVNFVDEFDFFNDSIARKIIELGINSIYISFDGATKATYEKIKRGCDFDKSLENIRRFLKLKAQMGSPFPVLHFRFIVTKLNFHEMPDFITLIDTLENRGVRARIEFVGLLSFPGIEQFYIPMSDIPEDILVETFENALKHRINLHLSHVQADLPPMDNCSAWTEPYILIGGEVISCCAIIMSNNRKFLRENSFGNVNQQSFLEIWQSEKYGSFRKQVNRKNGKVPKTCAGCRAFETGHRADARGINT